MACLPMSRTLLLASLLAGCSSSIGAVPIKYNPNGYASMVDNLFQHASGITKIKHVVIIIQENRTFNNLFMGYPGATTKTYGYLSTGAKVALEPAPLDESHFLLDYSLSAFLQQCNGTGSIPGTDCKMNGFDKVPWRCGSSEKCPIKYPPYSYVPKSQVKPYWDMAKQYVLADQMYASNLDESSFTSHQYIVAAQAMKAYDWPLSKDWGCEGGRTDKVSMLGPQRQYPDGSEVVCFNDKSLGQEADEAGITWADYSVAAGSEEGGGGWDGYQANRYVYKGRDWKRNNIHPPSQFLADVSAGTLRQITWITPTLTNSDHLGSHSSTGPMWVASLVNAIGQSKFWDSTAVFIFWDDPGGFYDPEPPAYVDYDGLGLRLPLLIISPYAKKGYVSHVHYEHGSILKFAEDVFGLPQLSASDTRATSPASDCFDFNQKPRKFVKIGSPLDIQYFIHQAPDLRPPDDH